MDKKKAAIVACAIIAIIAVVVGVIWAVGTNKTPTGGNNGSGDKVVVKKVDDWEFDGTPGTRDGLFSSITNTILAIFLVKAIIALPEPFSVFLRRYSSINRQSLVCFDARIIPSAT